MSSCTFYHPACNAGCTKAYCRAFFPIKSPVIMENQKSICKSDEHLECLIRLDGLEYHTDRIKNRKGCPFVTNSTCGHPNDWRCDGAIPPFKIEGANLELLSNCFGNEYPTCPNYVIGVKFRAEANRIVREREERARLDASSKQPI